MVPEEVQVVEVSWLVVLDVELIATSITIWKFVGDSATSVEGLVDISNIVE